MKKNILLITLLCTAFGASSAFGMDGGDRLPEKRLLEYFKESLSKKQKLLDQENIKKTAEKLTRQARETYANSTGNSEEIWAFSSAIDYCIENGCYRPLKDLLRSNFENCFLALSSFSLYRKKVLEIYLNDKKLFDKECFMQYFLEDENEDEIEAIASYNITIDPIIYRQLNDFFELCKKYDFQNNFIQSNHFFIHDQIIQQDQERWSDCLINFSQNKK